MPDRCLVLRLAAPLQSWGVTGQFQRRDTATMPTKSGIVGLLAAADGRRRSDAITDLVGLRLGIRVDQPGTILRDYHTVSNLTGDPLPNMTTTGQGRQRSTRYATKETVRSYLQDATFVAALHGEDDLLEHLVAALRNPTFPLALGRRACPPSQPLLLPGPSGDVLWPGDLKEVLSRVPWQAGPHHRRASRGAEITLPTVLDATDGSDFATDVPRSFDPPRRGMATRRVHHVTVTVAVDTEEPPRNAHDPFALLGG